jgi:AbrB family looped-hinge helix DNA binding protein
MKYFGTIGSQGQVTLPQEIRKRLGLSSGDGVEFVIAGEDIVIRPVPLSSNPFEKYKGILGTFPGGEKKIKAWLRELRSDEDGGK